MDPFNLVWGAIKQKCHPWGGPPPGSNAHGTPLFFLFFLKPQTFLPVRNRGFQFPLGGCLRCIKRCLPDQQVLVAPSVPTKRTKSNEGARPQLKAAPDKGFSLPSDEVTKNNEEMEPTLTGCAG